MGLMESPVRGNTHAGFGGRPAETDRLKGRNRAAGRPFNEGVGNLTEDAKEIAGRLAHCVQVYRHTDEAAQAHFDGIVQRAGGDDPAAQ